MPPAKTFSLGRQRAVRDRFVVGAPMGRWQTNCYVIGDRTVGAAAVIDPGEDAAGWVGEVLDREQVEAEAVLLTHGHLDHLLSVPQLAEALDVPVFLHPEDRWLWDAPAVGLGFPAEAMEEVFGPWDPPDERLEDLADDHTLTVGGVTYRVRHTPGHTPGHVTFLASGLADAEVVVAPSGWSTTESEQPSASAGVLLSGDLVFAGSVGRTDLPRGSTDELLASIRTTVLPLEDEILVLTGHGPSTTVGRERAHNPYLARLRAGHQAP